MVGEYNGSGALLRRYVHGPGSDEPLVWYEGSGTSDRRFLIADELGSIATVADASGAALANNTYTEFGAPGGSNTGRFQYTGQTWLPEAGLYNYKARVYSAALGRFLQTDPIGFGGGANFYAYVGNDPVNFVDPRGVQQTTPPEEDEIVVTAKRRRWEPLRSLPSPINFNWGDIFGSNRSGGLGQSDDPNNQRNDKCPTGPYVSGQYGVGGTLALSPGAISATLQVNLTGPLSTKHGLFSPVGSQVSVSGQVNLMSPGGLFIGAGTQYGVARQTQAARSGLSTAVGYHAEVNGGYVTAGGMSADTGTKKNGLPDFSNASAGLGGRVGGGFGIMGGVGPSFSATLASPQLGCRQ